MGQIGYVIITIAIVVILVAVFTISFVVYVRTPAPAGCKPGKGPNCENCEQSSCKFYSYAEDREANKRLEEKGN